VDVLRSQPHHVALADAQVQEQRQRKTRLAPDGVVLLEARYLGFRPRIEARARIFLLADVARWVGRQQLGFDRPAEHRGKVLPAVVGCAW